MLYLIFLISKLNYCTYYVYSTNLSCTKQDFFLFNKNVSYMIYKLFHLFLLKKNAHQIRSRKKQHTIIIQGLKDDVAQVVKKLESYKVQFLKEERDSAIMASKVGNKGAP